MICKKLGDFVKTGIEDGLFDVVGEVTQVCPTFCIVNFDGTDSGEWAIQKRFLYHAGNKQPTTTNKQISIERVGDKTSVTISGHLTKDDVQSILNLIF